MTYETQFLGKTFQVEYPDTVAKFAAIAEIDVEKAEAYVMKLAADYYIAHRWHPQNRESFASQLESEGNVRNEGEKARDFILRVGGDVGSYVPTVPSIYAKAREAAVKDARPSKVQQAVLATLEGLDIENLKSLALKAGLNTEQDREHLILDLTPVVVSAELKRREKVAALKKEAKALTEKQLCLDI